MEAVNNLDEIKVSKASSIDVISWKKKCYEAMNDDFNTPILIANLFEGAKFINLLKEEKQTISKDDLEVLKSTINNFVFDVLGLKNTTESTIGEDKLSGVVEMLIGMRKDARDNKNWSLSDQIRDELLVLGIQLKDGKDGTTFSVN